MDIYRLRFSLWVGPQGVSQFYERSEHLHAYGSTTRVLPATTRAGLGYGCGCDLAKPYLFREIELINGHEFLNPIEIN